MKKYITALVMAAVLGVMTPIAATAQTRSCNTRTSRESRTQYTNDRYYNDGYYDDGYDTYNDYGTKKPNVYDRHRKAMNIALATGAGAIIGALIGGKKGALIGAGAGVAAGAIVTKKQSSRNYPRY